MFCPFIDGHDGQRWAAAERKYVGEECQGFVEELQRLAKTGNLPVIEPLPST